MRRIEAKWAFIINLKSNPQDVVGLEKSTEKGILARTPAGVLLMCLSCSL